MQRTPIVEEDIRFVLAACRDELQHLSGKTLLLTGGSGFVGSYLVESIIAFNCAHDGAPCCLLLPTRSLEATQNKWPHFFGVENVTWFNWDSQALEPPGDGCDYVIHAAAPTDSASLMRDPYGAMHDIIRTTGQVVEYARQANASRLLFISSGAVYGPQPESLDAIPETFLGGPDLMDIRSCYGEAKRYAELLCRASGVPSTIARLFAFIGPYQDINGSFAVPDFLRQGMRDKTICIHSDGSALRTYCYASDLAAGLWKLLMKGMPGTAYNVGVDAPRISIRDLAESIASLIGDIEVVIEGKAAVGSRARYIPNTERFKRIYEAKVGLTEGLRRMLSSYAHAAARSS